MDRRGNVRTAALLLAVSPAAVCLALLASVAFGAKSIDWQTVWDSFIRFDPGNVDHQIVRHSRLPRAVGALLVGACLAVAGAVMQGMTRNDLASPSLLGVTDGAVLAVTVCMIAKPGAPSSEVMLWAVAGAAFGAWMVYATAAAVPNGLSPVRMTLIGAMMGAWMTAVSTALSTYFQVSQNISFWFNARLHQMQPDFVIPAVLPALVGLVCATAIARSVTAFALGEDVAVGLGQRVVVVKAAAFFTVAVTTGVAVALAGQIGFVGLIIPHVARMLVGVDYRRVVPCSAVLGALFLTAADVLARFINYPFETPVGVVLSAVGVPFFLYLIRRKGGRTGG